MRVWPWLGVFGLACAMSVACRITGSLMLLPLVVLLAVSVLRRGRWRELVRALPLVPLVPLAALPLLAQVVAMRKATRWTGSAEVNVTEIGYGKWETFLWFRPALLRTLFSSRNGLFFVAPVLLFAAVGIGRHLLRRGGWRDPLLVGLLLRWAILWYVNSAWYAWWFGSAFGQRAMLGMLALGLIGMGLSFEHAAAAGPAARRRLRRLVLVAVLWCWMIFAFRVLKIVPHDDFLVPAERWTVQGAAREL